MSWIPKLIGPIDKLLEKLLKILAEYFFENWLSNHPVIANAIVWRDNDHQDGRPYPSWSDLEKTQLFETYYTISRGNPLNLSATPSITVSLDNSGEVWGTYLDHDLAWIYYLAYVAQSLVIERSGAVPWSLTACTPEELSLILDSRSLFEWGTGPQKYGILRYHAILFSHGSATPGDPVRTFSFLTSNNLMGSTPKITIELLLEWCRSNLRHYNGVDDPANLQAYWQYGGYPPVERIISGTTHPTDGQGHWTAGCWGTTGFLRTVLRTANIPVMLEKRCGSGHALPHFVREGTYLSHGDDPYNALSKWKPLFPAGMLLIDQAKFDAWFGSDPWDSAACSNIGRRPYELAVTCLPYDLLSMYCDDKAQGKDHANGQVLQILKDFYTLSQLEAMNLWGNMDSKIAMLGGCASISELDWG